MHERVTAIGGGTGTPLVNESLIQAGVNYIDAVVAVTDSGGATGRMRTDSRGQEIAYSDAMRTLLSLVDPKFKNSPQYEALEELLKSQMWDKVLGHSIFSHFYDETDGFEKVQKELEKLTNIEFKGRVMPSTTASANIVFKTQFGRTYQGEHQLDDYRMSKDMVVEMELVPQVNSYGPAREAIANADYIIYSCGSLYGSVLVNFLPQGMQEALRQSKAKKYLVTNLASTRNESHEFTPQDFVAIFRKYTGLQHPIDMMIIPEMTRREFESHYPEITKRYDAEHSHFLGWEDTEIKKAQDEEGIEILIHQATIIVPETNTLRHDPNALSKVFAKAILP